MQHRIPHNTMQRASFGLQNHTTSLISLGEEKANTFSTTQPFVSALCLLVFRINKCPSYSITIWPHRAANRQRSGKLRNPRQGCTSTAATYLKASCSKRLILIPILLCSNSTPLLLPQEHCISFLSHRIAIPHMDFFSCLLHCH